MFMQTQAQSMLLHWLLRMAEAGQTAPANWASTRRDRAGRKDDQRTDGRMIIMFGGELSAEAQAAIAASAAGLAADDRRVTLASAAEI
ncbi:MAG: hypothetical protein IPK01_08530 [Acidobacteria bacterium]|nr:hypothetical protein [Acidobacteriota bacterium]